jgi:hypothetical protein
VYNTIGTSVHQNAVHRITNGDLMGLFRNGNNEVKINERLSFRISTKPEEGLREKRTIPFIALCKLSFVTDQHGYKSELPDNLWNFTEYRFPTESVYGLWDL